jgi:hypothetical protein
VPTTNSANRDTARRAIKAREQGQARIRSVTTAVTTASVITAGAVTLILPGSAHAPGRTHIQAGAVGADPSRRPGSFRKPVRREHRFRQFPLRRKRLQP